jgi:hypothetical protein
MSELLDASFSDAVNKEDIAEATEIYARLRGLLGPEQPMSETLFNYVELQMQRPSSAARVDWSDLLEAMATDARVAQTDHQESWAYYLLLVNCLLTKPSEFDATLGQFRDVVARQKNRNVKADRTDNEMLKRLASFVAAKDPKKAQSFDKVVVLARSL